MKLWLSTLIVVLSIAVYVGVGVYNIRLPVVPQSKLKDCKRVTSNTIELRGA